VAEGGAEPALGEAEVQVELGEEVLPGEGRRPLRVVDLIAALLELEPAGPRPVEKGVQRLRFSRELFAQVHRLRLEGLRGREAQEDAELLKAGLGRGLRADQAVLGLGALQPGAK